MLRKIYNKIKRKYRNYIAKKNFIFSKEFIEYKKTSQKMNFEDLKKELIYKDETWNYINNLDEYLNFIYNNRNNNINIYEDNECSKQKYKILNNNIIIDEQKDNNWICFFIKSLNTKKYEVSYDVEIESSFEEIQIAFNYANLGNRYRFMIRENKVAAFDCVYKGRFYNNIYTKNFTLEYKKKYNIKLVVLNNRFMYMIDDIPILIIKEKRKIVSGKDLLLIFYNKTNEQPVKCKIKNFEIHNIIEDK